MADQNDDTSSFWRSRSGIVLIGFVLIGGYFIVTEHRAHAVEALPYLPYILLFLCPLLHLFHGGHGGHGGERKDDEHRHGGSR